MRVRLVRVGDLAEQVRGVTYSKEDASTTPQRGYLPVLRAGNITDDGLVFNGLVFVPSERISNKQKVRRHDVVVAASSGSLDVVGKTAAAQADFNGGFGAFCKVLRPNSKVHPGYFAQFFKTQDYRRRVSALAAGANINNLRNEHLDEMQIPLPPVVDQRRIAEMLDRADALRAKRRAALAQLDSLTQAVFIDLFGDHEAKGWPIVSVAEIADAHPGSIRTGPFGSQLLHSEFVEKGVAVLGIDNAVANEFRWGDRRFISDAKYRELKRYTVQPGDVLITIMGTCGRCAVVPDEVPVAINTKHLCCITLDSGKCLPSFLHAYFLRHPIARRYLDQTAKGAIMSGLNMRIIKAMPIPMPPIQLQHEFTCRVAAVEKLKTAHRASLAEMDALFASLQHRAFRGDL
jgi:type I restriction enzyme S subunit